MWHVFCLVLCFVYTLNLSTIKCQRSVTLSPANPTQHGATFENMGKLGEVTTTESNQWNISAADAYSFHLGLHLSSEWAFNPNRTNTVSFTINSPTMIDDSFNDVLFAFQVSNQYVALRVTTTETYIAPRYYYVGTTFLSCPVQIENWYDPISGNVVTVLEQESPTSDLSRAEVLELPAVLSGYCRMRNISGLSGTQHLEMPLKFELNTYLTTNGHTLGIRYEAGGSESTQGLKTWCGYTVSDIFDSGLDIYMAVVQPGQNLIIDSIDITSDSLPVPTTRNPTTDPSAPPSAPPSAIPTTGAPSFTGFIPTGTPLIPPSTTTRPGDDDDQGDQQQNTSVWTETMPVWAVAVVVAVVLCACFGCIGCIVALVCFVLKKEQKAAMNMTTIQDQPPQPSLAHFHQNKHDAPQYDQQQQERLSEQPPHLSEQPGSVVNVSVDAKEMEVDNANAIAIGTGVIQMMPRSVNAMHAPDESQQLEGPARTEPDGHREISRNDDDDDDGSELFKPGIETQSLETAQTTSYMS
mmetsp:Transcript_48281/g.80036  ORF Transcript_48281/g.80036 Transcript_48281/m.80036 type:complete len:523 (+) Transcript_48281:34-1602(+)